MFRIATQLLLFEPYSVSNLLHDWGEDAKNFLRHDALRIFAVVVGALILIRVTRIITRGITSERTRKLAPGLRTQQVHTLASVSNSIISFVILFVAGLQALAILGFNLGPLLASAGIAGLAIGFGAQTLVKDFINGFFVLLDDQYNIGDKVQIAGLKGTVEDMTLRRTVLRDDDGTLHIIPNSQVVTVSNMTRDWAQLTLKVTVAYSEPTEKIVKILQELGDGMRHDPEFQNDIVADVQVPGIDRVGNGEAEYLMLVKTRPNQQYGVSRELRRRIKESFEKNDVKTGPPGRIFVAEQSK
ncbi:MAG TPA: mechanosensitive ion channel family protein [Terriglobales bacterium]|jgi:small conductance mechanosensitive channel